MKTRYFFPLSLLLLFVFTEGKSQETTDTSLENNYVYRPYSQRMRLQDSIADADTNSVISTPVGDSLNPELQAKLDSIRIREAFVQDSIAQREQFVRDSILAREQFVRDSLLRRQQILDSLIFLKAALPPLLSASAFTMNEDIILKVEPIVIEGDSILTDYNYIKLPNRFSDPYTPWLGSINLSTNPAEFEIDTVEKLIKLIKAPGINNMFDKTGKKNIVVIKRQGMFTSNYGDKFYKAPIDSIFFNAKGEPVKIKRYYKMYQATESFQLGAFLFDFLWQVKQFEYNASELNSLEIVKFCDRWKKNEPQKACNIARYTIKKIGYSYEVIRANDPVNNFSDGTYRYEFDNLNNLKSVTFRNTKNTENWKTFIEMNEQGFVSRYVYQDKGIVNRTLLVHYYLDDPKAKHKVETVTCTFEDDGISYYQHNNTTGQSRVRDRLTGEWSRWENN
jgi:hypothetical protein